MDLDFNDHSNTMRCPKCQWVSITKVSDLKTPMGICMEPTGDHFVCTNPACQVERIYGENGVYIVTKA